MKTLIAEIAKKLSEIQGTQFASFTYLSKKANELARHTVILGANYHNLVVKSKTELEILMQENADKWTPIQKQAADKIMASLNKTLAAHERGEQNEDYTKKGQYVSIGNGLNLNTNDNTLQLFVLRQNKVVLSAGEYGPDNRRPLTKAQDEIKKQLSMNKFKEFALDLSQMAAARINGNTLEMEAVGGHFTNAV
jgi:PHD/YefM family antitoxin component YafN of YafNO toxin-antitoxin module